MTDNKIKIALALISLTCLAMIAGCAGTPDEQLVMQPRRVHFGIHLPYPERIPVYDEDTLAVKKEIERAIPLVMTVGVGGKVVDVRTQVKRDASALTHYAPYIRKIRFEPGMIDSVKTEMRIPAVMEAAAPGTRPRFRFPVERNRAIIETGLYWLALEMNGVTLPEIKRFPSYGGKPVTEPRQKSYPYILLRVNLDAEGTVTAVEPVLSTHPAFTDQLVSAVNWAEYTQLKVRGEAHESENYVLISFFSDVKYPTSALDFEAGLSTLSDQLRVRIYPDTVGLMSLPIPLGYGTGNVNSSNVAKLSEHPLSGRLIVEPGGVMRLSDISPDSLSVRDSRKLQLACRQIMGVRVNMAPAMDFQGQSQPYSGLVRFERQSEELVRIDYSWVSRILRCFVN